MVITAMLVVFSTNPYQLKYKNSKIEKFKIACQRALTVYNLFIFSRIVWFLLAIHLPILMVPTWGFCGIPTTNNIRN